MAYLEIRDVSKTFGRQKAVDAATITIEKGELVSFLGGSGCGKTTTLRMVAGFEIPDSGTISIDGTDVEHVPANKRNIGMVFQHYALFPNMSVHDNIAFGLSVAGKKREAIDARVAELLALIHLSGFEKRFPHQLSGGQQQRVALARALAIEPRVLLLDEPLSALDAKIRASLREEIRAVQRTLGITTVYVTHDQEEALSMSDRIVVMKDGRVQQIGTPSEVYHRPANEFVASFIGTLNLFNAVVEDPSLGRMVIDGSSISTVSPINAPKGSTVRLAVRPEMIRVLDGDHNGQNSVEGSILRVSFLGSIVRLGVTVAGREISVDAFNDPHRALPAVGSRVRLGFAPDACTVLARDAG